MGLACGKKSKMVFIYDISLNIKYMNEITNIIRKKMEKYDCFVVGYGHIGDSNLHINVGCLNKDKF